MPTSSDDPMVICIARIAGNEDLPVPASATGGSAGLDLRAGVDGAVILRPGERKLIPTGFSIAIPEGYEGQVRSRSGLALKQGLGLLNSPGTIDADYRGEIGVIAVNLGQEPITIRRGDRIAQLVIAPAPKVRLQEIARLQETGRGGGGFGHTGTS